jgi:D-serine deaminase-like pyridoxal phosphate-dependent protein
VYLKVDVGYHRAGVSSENHDQLLTMAKLMSDNCDKIDFQGLYAHCGHSYQGGNAQEIQGARDEAILKVAEMMTSNGIKVKCQGIGSTPSCSQPVGGSTGQGLTEIHPGNYVFYDVQQLLVGF